MKHKKLFSRLLLALILIATIFGIYRQVRAQEEIVTYLGEKLKQQNVPFVEIVVLQKLPINLQVVIQSASDGEKATPDDPINLNLVSREIILANRQGYFVERFAIVLLNNKGEPMARTERSTEIADIFIDTRPSSINNETASGMITNKINLYGMSLIDLDVSSLNGLQTTTIRLSTPSVDVANQALPRFMPSLRLLLEDINAKGSQIVNCKLELRDENGNLLLNYILDLQLRAENWWMADNLTNDWFPHP